MRCYNYINKSFFIRRTTKVSTFSCCADVSGRKAPEKLNRIKADKRTYLLFSKKDKSVNTGTGRESAFAVPAYQFCLLS